MIIKAFTKTFGEYKLDAAQMQFSPKKIYAMVGSNGSGKSTYAKCAAAVIEPDEKSGYLCTGTVGYMSQTSFAFRMSVKKNILLSGCSDEMADALIKALGLESIAKKNGKKLSGGQRARMALARALSKEFDLLILDEPCASMDMQSTLESEKCIRGYADAGHAVLLITHSLAQAERIADDIIFMDNGSVIESGAKDRMINNPYSEKTKEFLKFFR